MQISHHHDRISSGAVTFTAVICARELEELEVNLHPTQERLTSDLYVTRLQSQPGMNVGH